MARLKEFDEAVDLEKRLEELEHGMFIDTLIKIDNNITSNSLYDYIPIYVSDRFRKNNKNKILSLLENEVYIESFIDYLLRGRIKAYELLIIIEEYDNRELLARKIISTVIHKDVMGFMEILRNLRKKLE